MTREQFLESAQRTFGNKIIVQQLTISEEDAARLKLNAKDVNTYPAQAWLVGKDGAYYCPHCGAQLGGVLGSFAWDVIHGIGRCTSCDKVDFRYYHYVTDLDKLEPGQSAQLRLFAVCGFSKEIEKVA